MPISFLLAMMTVQTAPDPVAKPVMAGAPGDRLLPLVERKADPGRYCTADGRWCVALGEAGEGGEVLPAVQPGGAARAPQQAIEDSYAGAAHAVWPRLILLSDGGFLAGVETRTSTGYSGGGGSASELHLFRVAADGQPGPAPVLRVPIDASLMIRACFGERDMARRLGACHDEYGFSGEIRLASVSAFGLPVLLYRAEARAYPRGVSRLEDSTQMPRLKKADLVWERDAGCSFSRRFRFDVATGAYLPDTPLPDCSAYTIP